MSKRITLCADDFAQTHGISQAILQLLQMGRLSATSVMSQSALWPVLAPALRELSGQVDVGLHFNLTHPFDNRARPLPYWLLRSQLHGLSGAALCGMLLEQIDAFADAFGRLPDFIDGHQHVHALPMVREALFAALSQRWSVARKPYLRAPDRLAHAGDAAFKALLLKGLCRGFEAQAQRHGYACPRWFGGLYSLTAQADFAGWMRTWLTESAPGALLMCHPGPVHVDAGDAIGPARANEFAYLHSTRFAEDCQATGVVIGRFDMHITP